MDTLLKDIVQNIKEIFIVFWEITRKIIEVFWINFVVVNLYVGFYLSRVVYHTIRFPKYLWTFLLDLLNYLKTILDKFIIRLKTFLENILLHIRRFFTVIWDYIDIALSKIFYYLNKFIKNFLSFFEFILKNVIYNIHIIIPLTLIVLPIFFVYSLLKHLFISFKILFLALAGKPYSINEYRRFYIKPKYSPIENLFIGFNEYSINLRINITYRLSGTRKLNFSAVNNYYVLLNYILVLPLLVTYSILLFPLFFYLIFLGRGSTFDNKSIQRELVVINKPIEDVIYISKTDNFFGKKITYFSLDSELLNVNGVILANKNISLLNKKTKTAFKIILGDNEFETNIEIPVLFNEDTLLKSYFIEFPPIGTFISHFDALEFQKDGFKIEFDPYSFKQITKEGQILIKDYTKTLQIPIKIKVFFSKGKFKNHYFSKKTYLTVPPISPVDDLNQAMELIPESVYQSNGKLKFNNLLKNIKLTFSSPENNVITKSGQILPTLNKKPRNVLIKLLLGNNEVEKTITLFPKAIAKKLSIKQLSIPTLFIEDNSIHLPKTVVFNDIEYAILWRSVFDDHFIEENSIELPNIRISSFNFSIIGAIYNGEKFLKEKRFDFKIKKTPSKNAILDDFNNIKSEMTVLQNGDVNLPNWGTLYGSNITWLSNTPYFYSSSGIKNKKFERKKFLEDKLTFTLLMEYGNRSLVKKQEFEIDDKDSPIIKPTRPLKSNVKKLSVLEKLLGKTHFKKVIERKFNFFDWPRLLSLFSLFFSFLTAVYITYPIFGFPTAIALQVLQIVISINSLVIQMIKKRLWDSIFSSVMFLLILSYVFIWLFYPGFFTTVISSVIQSFIGVLSTISIFFIGIFNSIAETIFAILSWFASIPVAFDSFLSTLVNSFRLILIPILFIVVSVIALNGQIFRDAYADEMKEGDLVYTLIVFILNTMFCAFLLSYIGTFDFLNPNFYLISDDGLYNYSFLTNFSFWIIIVSSGVLFYSFLSSFSIGIFEYNDSEAESNSRWVFLTSLVALICGLFILYNDLVNF